MNDGETVIKKRENFYTILVLLFFFLLDVIISFLFVLCIIITNEIIVYLNKPLSLVNVYLSLHFFPPFFPSFSQVSFF